MRWRDLLFGDPLGRHGEIALLVMRTVCGVAFVTHGWSKIQQPLSWMGPETQVPAALQALAALSEFGGGLAWILGVFTPLASLGILSTMAVATFRHAFVRGDPFVGTGPSYELALVYFSVALALLLLGPGRFSVDALLSSRASRSTGG